MNIFFNSRINANQSLLNVLFGQQQKAASRQTRTSAGAISLFLIISPQFLSISFNFPSCRDNIISADGMLYLV